MSTFNLSGKIDLANNTFGYGEFQFNNCQILLNGEIIEEKFTGTLDDLKQKHPNLDFTQKNKSHD